MPGLSVDLTCKIYQLCWIHLHISWSISLTEYVWISGSQNCDCTMLSLSESLLQCTKYVLNFWTYQSDKPVWFSSWIFLNPGISFLNFFFYRSDWICLKQCLPALSMYWISVSISLAESMGPNEWIFLNPNIFFLIS